MTPVALDGGLDLSFSRVGRWYDDQTTWPDWLRLEGSHYDAINADPGNDSARRRLDWLKLQQDGYTPRRMSSSPPSIGVPGASEAPVL